MRSFSLPAKFHTAEEKPKKKRKRTRQAAGGSNNLTDVCCEGSEDKSETTRWNSPSEFNDGLLKRIQTVKENIDKFRATHVYSVNESEDESMRHHLKWSVENMIRHPVNVPSYNDGTLVCVLASITFFVQILSRDIWIPLFEPALIAFPAWSQISLALFPFWDSLVSNFLMIPACVAINKYGIKTILFWSCVASTFGTMVRLLIHTHDSTIILHVSTVFLSIASVVVKPLTVTISACCFKQGQRNLVTGFMTCASILGTAAGLFVTIVLREPSSYVPKTLEQLKNFVYYTMTVCFFLNFICTLLVYFTFPRETPTASVTKWKFDISNTSMLRAIFKNRNLLLIGLTYASSNAFSWSWYQMIDITFSRMGLPQRVGMDCRFWIIIHTCVLTLSVCWLADHLAGSNKWCVLVCQFLATGFMLLIMITLNYRKSRRETINLVIGTMMTFPLSFATRSLLFELAAENAYPLPKSFAVGFIELLKQTVENSAYFLMASFPTFHLYWLHVFTFVACLFSVVSIAFLKGTQSNK